MLSDPSEGNPQPVGASRAQRSGAWRWALAGAVGMLALGAAFVALLRPLGMRIAALVISQGTGKQPLRELPDGLHAGLCGSGSPLPDATRAGPCVFVIAGQRLYIVDAGEGSPRKLALMGIGPPLIHTILLTHFHSDHIGGLGELMLQRWAGSGSPTPVEVIGPQGVESVVEGLHRAYEHDTGYRVAHHGAATMPPLGAGGVARPFQLPAGRDVRQVVLESDGLTITAFNVIHTPVFPAVGYRFDYKGRSLVVSGDTAPSEWLADSAKGVDLLFHEALEPTMVGLLHARAVKQGMANLAKITADIPSYHTSPAAAARLAEQAKVGRLIFYHTIPPLPTPLLYPAFLGDAPTIYHGPITVGKDGLLVSLPATSKAIVLRELL